MIACKVAIQSIFHFPFILARYYTVLGLVACNEIFLLLDVVVCREPNVAKSNKGTWNSQQSPHGCITLGFWVVINWLYRNFLLHFFVRDLLST